MLRTVRLPHLQLNLKCYSGLFLFTSRPTHLQPPPRTTSAHTHAQIFLVIELGPAGPGDPGSMARHLAESTSCCCRHSPQTSLA